MITPMKPWRAEFVLFGRRRTLNGGSGELKFRFPGDVLHGPAHVFLSGRRIPSSQNRKHPSLWCELFHHLFCFNRKTSLLSRPYIFNNPFLWSPAVKWDDAIPSTVASSAEILESVQDVFSWAEIVHWKTVVISTCSPVEELGIQ